MKEPAWPLALEGQIRFDHVEIRMKEREGNMKEGGGSQSDSDLTKNLTGWFYCQDKR